MVNSKEYICDICSETFYSLAGKADHLELLHRIKVRREFMNHILCRLVYNKNEVAQ